MSAKGSDAEQACDSAAYHRPAMQSPLSQAASLVQVAPEIPHDQLPDVASCAQVDPVGTGPLRFKPWYPFAVESVAPVATSLSSAQSESSIDATK